MADGADLVQRDEALNRRGDREAQREAGESGMQGPSSHLLVTRRSPRLDQGFRDGKTVRFGHTHQSVATFRQRQSIDPMPHHHDLPILSLPDGPLTPHRSHRRRGPAAASLPLPPLCAARVPSPPECTASDPPRHSLPRTAPRLRSRATATTRTVASLLPHQRVLSQVGLPHTGRSVPPSFVLFPLARG